MTDDRELLAELWLDLCEKDRTSPEDYPEMCLIDQGELGEYLARAREEGRGEALEEAAKAAEAKYSERYRISPYAWAGFAIATAIRSLKGQSNG